jgi:hypothetical protein
VERRKALWRRGLGRSPARRPRAAARLAPADAPDRKDDPTRLLAGAGGGRGTRGRVALEIVKPGLDTREVVARFEAERQAIALMDHPNIRYRPESPPR